MKKLICKHTKHPEGFIANSEWMAKKSKTHNQYKCPACSLYTIWIKKDSFQDRMLQTMYHAGYYEGTMGNKSLKDNCTLDCK